MATSFRIPLCPVGVARHVGRPRAVVPRCRRFGIRLVSVHWQSCAWQELTIIPSPSNFLGWRSRWENQLIIPSSDHEGSHPLTSAQLYQIYEVAVVALWLYDYFLTLPREVIASSIPKTAVLTLWYRLTIVGTGRRLLVRVIHRFSK